MCCYPTPDLLPLSLLSKNDVRETVDGIEKMLGSVKQQVYGAATRSLDLADAEALTKENAVHTLFERFLRKEDVNGERGVFWFVCSF